VTKFPPFFIPVSKLCKYDFCNKASKILIFDNPKYNKGANQTYMTTGTHMHTRFSEPYKDFERRVFRYRLKAQFGEVYSRNYTFHQIRGIPDDYEIFTYKNDKYVSIIELKTTHKHKLILAEIKSFIFQLQLYIWILEPLLESMGYKLSEHHILEIHSQTTGKILKRYDVEPEPNMEEKLRYIFDCFRGQQKMRVPPRWVCKVCSKPVKEACDWYKMRKTSK